MNIFVYTSIICLLNLSRVLGQDLSTERNTLEILCDVFPQICKDKFPQSSSIEKPAHINIKIHAEINIEVVKEKAPCELCEKILNELNSTEMDKEELKKTLKQVCNTFPDISRHRCKDFVDEFGDDLVQNILANIPIDTICQKIGLSCPVELDISSASCELCKKILNKIINTKHNKEELEKALKHVCHIFPRGIRHKCEKFVQKYGEKIVKLILEEIPLNLICRRIGLCSPPKEDVSSVPCEICKKILNELINTKRNKEELKKALKHVCHIFPHVIRHKCDDFVHKYGDLIVKLILDKVPFYLICIQIGLCSPLEDDASPVICEICKFVLDELSHTKRTKEELEKALDQICHYFPLQRHRCEDFVNEYKEQIIKLILDNVPFELICQKIGLCSSTENDVSPITCQICKMVLDKLINTKRNRKELKKALDNACHIFPKVMRRPCEDFVRKYGNQIVRLILNNVPFNLICRQIGLCTPLERSGTSDTLYYLPRFD